ncbi:hypothetical protein FS935_21215 [Metabacillus litoralis]|uniref:YfjD family protein n=1 Tax=Metabacillus litoralis TaxID=152268 RepID=A0A5C6VFQ8_9BACI|nr:DUF5381 family protein [Metabacillus litoralis]TXC82218.1 hypothetical protein FS935_21215 [Metabacillus litoralis]
MLNVKKIDETIKIKGSKFMYGWMILFYLGGLLGCLFLIVEGFSFESNYSLIYLSGGIMFFPIFLYLTSWSLPAFIPGKILLTIVQGKNGTINSKKGTVFISNIRNIDLVRNPLNLINDIIIETFDSKKIKIRTYNLIDELDYQVMVDQYIFPYMTENTKEVWDRKVNLDLLLKEVRYERQERQERKIN